MKIRFVILLLSLLSFPFSAQAQPQEGKMRSYDVEHFAKQIKRAGVIVVDVRTQKEFSEGHIAEAEINIDVLKSNFLYHAHRELPRNRTIALYCKGGVRSKRAASKLAQCGYKVFDLDKGYDSWVENKMPVSK